MTVLLLWLLANSVLLTAGCVLAVRRQQRDLDGARAELDAAKHIGASLLATLHGERQQLIDALAAKERALQLFTNEQELRTAERLFAKARYDQLEANYQYAMDLYIATWQVFDDDADLCERAKRKVVQ
jgi:tetratricopeptide (TPR) repeat protein